MGSLDVTCHRIKIESQAVFQAKTQAKNVSIELPSSFLVVGGESVELLTYGLDTVYYYREVQLDSTPEIKVFHMLFERCRTNKRAMAL